MILTVTRQDMPNVTTTSVRGNAARVGPWTSMESVQFVRFQKFITFLHVVELLLFFFTLSFFFGESSFNDIDDAISWEYYNDN